MEVRRPQSLHSFAFYDPLNSFMMYVSDFHIQFQRKRSVALKQKPKSIPFYNLING